MTWTDTLAWLDAHRTERVPVLNHPPRHTEVGVYDDTHRRAMRVHDGDYRMTSGERLVGLHVTGKIILPKGNGVADACWAERGIVGPTDGSGRLRARHCDIGSGKGGEYVANGTKGAVELDSPLLYGLLDAIQASGPGRFEHRNVLAHSCRYIRSDPGQDGGPSHNDLGQAVNPQGQIVVNRGWFEAWSFRPWCETVTRDPASNPHRGNKDRRQDPASGYQTSGFLSGKPKGPDTYLELTDVDLMGHYNQAIVWWGRTKFTRVRVAADTGVYQGALFGGAKGQSGVTACKTDRTGILP